MPISISGLNGSLRNSVSNASNFPVADVEFAERANWPFWGGIGWRSDLRHSIGLIGAYSPVIRIHHRPYRSSLLGIPLTVTDLYLSVDDPDAILAEFSSHASR